MKQFLLFLFLLCCFATVSRASNISGTITYTGTSGAAVNQKIYLLDSFSGNKIRIDSTLTSSTGTYSFTLTMNSGHIYGIQCNSCGYPSILSPITSSTSTANLVLVCLPIIVDTVRLASNSAPLAGQKVYIKNSTLTYLDSAYTNTYGAAAFQISSSSVTTGTLTVYTNACGVQSQSFSYAPGLVYAPTLYVCNPPVVSGTLTNASTSSGIPFYYVTLIDSSATAVLYKDSMLTNSSGAYSFILPFATPAGNIIVTAKACGNRYANNAAYTGSSLTLNLSACASSSATISGTLVIAGTSTPIVGQKVYFLDSNSTLTIRDSMLTNASGVYSFNIPASTPTATLRVSTISCGVLGSMFQPYSGSSIVLPAWNIYTGPARTISGATYYRNGTGVSGANVIIHYAGTTTSPNLFATTNASGAYSVSVPCDWNASTLTVSASMPASTCSASLVDSFLWTGNTLAGLKDTFFVNPAATITGNVYYANGTPVTSGQVLITNWALTPPFGYYYNISSTGTYSATLPCNWPSGTLSLTTYDYLNCSSPYHYFNFTGSNVSGINDTVCYYRVSGTVTKQGGGAAANAKVYVVRSYQDTSITPVPTTLTAIDSTVTNAAGFYQFELGQDPYAPVGGGRPSFYATFIKAALQPSDPAYTNFLPTYHDSVLVWSSADTVGQMTWYNRSAGVNVSLRAGANPGGPAFIGGNVLLGANKASNVGDPLSQRILLLTTASGKAVGYTYSDAAGRFAFPNLAYGSYMIFGDAWGKKNPALAVTLSAASPAVSNIIFEENSEHFEGRFTTGVPGVSPLEAVSIYPNPVTTQLNFVGLSAIKGDKRAVVRNATGAIVLDTKLNGNSVDASRLPAGIYMVQLVSEGGTANFRFVKE